MKKTILFLLTILFCAFSYSQVKYDQIIKSKYVAFYEWSYSKDTYLETGADWLDMTLDPNKDYYKIEIGNDGDVEKVWWEYQGKEEGDDGDDYYTEDGRKIYFNYEKQEIWFFYDYNQSKNRYESLMVASKLTAYDK